MEGLSFGNMVPKNIAEIILAVVIMILGYTKIFIIFTNNNYYS